MSEIMITRRLSLIIAWYDFWIGAYYNQEKKQSKYQHYIDIPSGMHEALEQTKKLSGGVLYMYRLSEGTISFELTELT